MPKGKTGSSSGSTQKIRPAFTPEARTNQMISLAENLAERQLLDGTASSQVITHYLKLGTDEARLKIEQLEEENKLLRARTKALEESANMTALYEQAISAMKRYSGNGDSDDY